MDELWHAEPEMTPTGMDLRTIERFDAIFAQVEASQAVTAGLAEAQAMHGLEDMAVLEALNAAAAAGSLISVQALTARLT